MLEDGKDKIIFVVRERTTKMPSLCRLPNAIFAVSLIKSQAAKKLVNIKKTFGEQPVRHPAFGVSGARRAVLQQYKPTRNERTMINTIVPSTLVPRIKE